MLANLAFVPVDSCYEAMTGRLIAEGRAFEKPLRHIDQAPVHPDFRLTDTTPETVVEVLGLAGNPEYNQRIAEKRAPTSRRQALLQWTNSSTGPGRSAARRAGHCLCWPASPRA